MPLIEPVEQRCRHCRKPASPTPLLSKVAVAEVEVKTLIPWCGAAHCAKAIDELNRKGGCLGWQQYNEQ